MVAERAIPFTTAVQTLLKAELNTECQIGATFDKAYCGVVGGVARHEYAVLGPSVNLAARLMGHPNNTGFLVDESVKEKAGSRKFRALPPVKAKGYKHLVQIFEPLQTPDPVWNDVAGQFVGRENELSQMVAMAEEVVEKGGPAKFFLVTAESGVGKSALCRQASKKIKEMCASREIPHLNIGTSCSEGDVFVPFSITRPLFLEILNYLHDIENPGAPPRDTTEIIGNDDIVAWLQGDLSQEDASESLLHLVEICEMVEIPDQFIEILGKLVLTRNRADVVDGPNNAAHVIMLNKIASYTVKAFLNCTVSFDLVVLALDDVANMDEMSWKIVELLYHHSQNMLIVSTTRPVENGDLKASVEFWENLHGEALDLGHFKELSLEPMKQSDVKQLVAKRLGHRESDVDPQISHEVFVKSGGMPNIASEIIAQLYNGENPVELRDSSGRGDSSRAPAVAGIDVGNIGEIVLHRMDSLPSSVRTHLNLGAILGSAFELMDVVTVFEQYRGVQKDERLKHAKSVHESLDEAVKKGILEVTDRESAIHARYNASDHPYAAHNTIYKFTHDVWRSNILRLTLDEWKKDMHSLIAQSMETVMDSQLANDYRVLTRLFSHWKESGSAKKAATLALKMGRSLEDIGLTHQSLIVYRESLDMWKAMDNSNEVPDETIGGLSVNLLENLESSDVEHLIKLNVALGRCYTNILDPKESIRCFQTALNFIHKAPSSVLLEDRSIIFPVFSGLFIALRFGHNEDFQYEQGLVKMFLRETKLYNDPVHYSRALAMQAEMFARHRKVEAALETSNDLRELYNVDEHSNLIATAYGSDRSGQCIAQSALWNEHLNNHEEALKTCDYVISELLPKMDPQNVYNSFHMLYPVVWVMKTNGRALEAREAFGKFVVHNFMTRLDDRGLTCDRPLHTPTMALLDMVGTDCKTERLEEYAKWALVEQNGLFGSELNFIMGSAGRTADSITAEMCLLLAHHTSDRVEKTIFVCKGFEVARDAMELTREKEESHGMVLAYNQVKPIFEELEEMHAKLPPERRSRRLSCRW
jgi:tetratricopeptide (TPR) repeat protein